MKWWVLLLLGLVACDPEALETLGDDPARISIEAPEGRCWSGAIGDATRDGCGSRSFNVQESITVATVQKQDSGRWRLRVTLEIGGEVVDTSQTNALFGVVTVSE